MSFTVASNDFSHGILAAAVFSGAQVQSGASTTFNGQVISKFEDAFPEAANLITDKAAFLGDAITASGANAALATSSTVTSSSVVTIADAFVAGALISQLSAASVASFPNAVRFFNYVMGHVGQNGKTLAEAITATGVQNVALIPVPTSRIFTMVVEAPGAVEKKPKDAAEEKKAPAAAEEKKQAKAEKAPKAEKPAAAAAATPEGGDDEAAGNDVGRMKVVVAKVVDVANHPTEAKLLVLQLNVGTDAPIQVVAGIAEFAPKESLTNATLAVITNLKPGEVKGVNSVGRCIVATAADGSVKELIRPADSCPAGEVIAYRGVTQQFDAQLAPKRFHKILKTFSTNANREVQCQGAVFETSAGVLAAPTVANGTVA